MASEAYIVECVRTAGGRRNGQLSGWHPADLGAACVDEVMKRTNLPKDAVDDVIWGVVTPVGAQAANLGRLVSLSSGLDLKVPGCTVDRQCGSSQQALHFAAQAIMSGTQDIIIAGGGESMSTVPIWCSVGDGIANGRGVPMGDSLVIQYLDRMEETYKKYDLDPTFFSQFAGAELVVENYGLTRQDMDRFAAQSHAKAVNAKKNNRFAKEIVPLQKKTNGQNPTISCEGMAVHDEGIRPSTTVQGLAKLKPLQKGLVTAGQASQICDGAACLLVCSKAAVQKYNLRPRAKVVCMHVTGCDPIVMLDGPIEATRQCLRKANLPISAVDLYEINEAFASVPLAWYIFLGNILQKRLLTTFYNISMS